MTDLTHIKNHSFLPRRRRSDAVYYWLAAAFIAMIWSLMLFEKHVLDPMIPEAHASTCTTLEDCCSQGGFINQRDFCHDN